VTWGENKICKVIFSIGTCVTFWSPLHRCWKLLPVANRKGDVAQTTKREEQNGPPWMNGWFANFVVAAATAAAVVVAAAVVAAAVDAVAFYMFQK